MAEIDPGKYTIAIVIVMIFVCLSVILWAIRIYGNASSGDIAYPPYTSPCPDFWVSTAVNGDGTHVCRPLKTPNADAGGPNSSDVDINGLPRCDASLHNSASPHSNVTLGTTLSYDTGASQHNPTVDFTGTQNSDKCKWASKCGVHWEGISDYACEELPGGSAEGA